MSAVQFVVERKLPRALARAGTLHTPHGDIKTPAFIAVGTKATIKGILPNAARALSVQGVIANAYHLYLQPGEKVVESAGGVGAFMNWSGPTMSDSGGFQVFSLGEGFGKKISKLSFEEVLPEEGLAVFDEELATSHGKLALVDEEGVSFTSHIDGSLHRFTPERSIEIQHALGADILFSFDECTSPAADYAYQKEAMERTHAWAKRSIASHRSNIRAQSRQALFGIVQGGRYEDLRIESARTLARLNFDGYGIGGSFSKRDLLGILDKVSGALPEEKPRHLLGIGDPEDMLIGVAAGIDTFDCVLPTRNGRAGTLYTERGKINIENAKYVEDFGPIEKNCHCPVCTAYSRAYLNHLFRAREMLGPILASTHNLYFLVHFAERIRQSILDGSFERFREHFLEQYQAKT